MPKRPLSSLLPRPFRRIGEDISREIALVPAGQSVPGVLGSRLAQVASLKAEEFRGASYRRAKTKALKAELARLLPESPEEFEALLLGGLLAARPETPKVSIVIPVYGKLELTLRCLVSLARANDTTPFEIIIVDDCSPSPDRTPEVVPKIPGVRFLRNPENGGFIVSTNAGAAVARGEYLYFLNNDTVVLPGFLDRLVETLDTIPRAGLVGSKLIFPDFSLQEAGGIVWRDASATNFGNGGDPFAPSYSFLRDADYVSAASALVRRSLFEELGGFDLRYRPAYYEDTDLAFAVRARGYRTLMQPASKIIHYEGSTSGTDVKVGPKRYQLENQTKFREKWASVLASHGEYADRSQGERDRVSRGTILVVSHAVPMPDRDSGSVDLFHLLVLLRNFGYRVIFLAAHPVPRGMPGPNLRKAAGKYTEALEAVGIECPHFPYYHSVEGFLRQRGSELDLVMLCRARIADRFFGSVKRNAPRAKIVFNTVDLHYLREEREAAQKRSLFIRTMARDTKRRELGVVRKSDMTLVLSAAERKVLEQEVPSARLVEVPLLREIPGRSVGAKPRKDVLFVGGFRHRPNVDAVTFFVKDVWPLVARELPSARFHVVGSDVPDSIASLASENVVVHGFVPDLDDLHATCRLSVAPLRFGAGLKGKVASSLGYGLPCVATTIAVEGSGLEDERDVLIADDPIALAKAIVRLHSDDALWTRLSDAGLVFVEREYSLDANRRRLAGLLDELGLAHD